MYNKCTQQIKSFVLRQGKITQSQKKAVYNLMPKYGIEFQEQMLDLNKIFKRDNPKIIEIGFGMGHATWQIAMNNPNNDYLGIEVHTPGVGSLLIQIEQCNITNLKLIRHDALSVFKNMIADNSISGIYIFFPDPWPKKRHHKRRIIQTEFVDLLCDKLIKGGFIHLATDWEDYAHWILNKLTNSSKLVNKEKSQGFIQKPDYRPLTKFEERGINLGHNVWDLIFTKI
ncbi:MAG TPA: tRNA (guanosine(46)-N7)-methyltransferase TrmB [Burkholderiales bacterium]|nr:tRNA (guanosine(46)-N7)-methyltransferase TrmB [Burkholderiales bacterium]